MRLRAASTGLSTRQRLYEAIGDGTAKYLRPKFMTFAAMSVGLIPILESTGTGSEIMKRIAAPMVGGICTSFILEPLVYPAIYAGWRETALQQKINRNEIIASAMSETSAREAMALGAFTCTLTKLYVEAIRQP